MSVFGSGQDRYAKWIILSFCIVEVEPLVTQEIIDKHEPIKCIKFMDNMKYILETI